VRPHAYSRLESIQPAHPNVPEPDLAIPGARDEFAHAAALHMDVCDPLLVVAPAFDHGDAGFEAIVEEADGAVAGSKLNLTLRFRRFCPFQ
jgi:hypothetical protein